MLIQTIEVYGWGYSLFTYSTFRNACISAGDGVPFSGVPTPTIFLKMCLRYAMLTLVIIHSSLFHMPYHTYTDRHIVRDPLSSPASHSEVTVQHLFAHFPPLDPPRELQVCELSP